ncbi:MAG TPA: helix-turn-helix transcriptional regulator [Candidatus Angelobacter sp.]|nr:helix-turn-helix transcriptional regulator [Candidatus Angelobacter sp.]
MRLSPKDFDAFQRAVLALHECRDLETFRHALPEILLSIIPVDHFFLQEVKFSPATGRGKIVGTIDPSGQVTPEMEHFSEEALLDHPFPKYFVRTGDWSALLLSDFQTVHQFRRTDIYQRFYHEVRVDRLLGMPTDFGPNTVGGICLANQRGNFSERDRLILNLLRPHIELAHRNAAWRARGAVDDPQPANWKLTPRESEIARWLAAGKTNREIAIILKANVRTVEKHVEKILEKLCVENRTSAAAILLTNDGQPSLGIGCGARI